MSELFLIIKNFTLDNPTFVTWLITVLIFIIGLFLQTSWIKEYIREWKLNRLLKNIGSKSLHNVSILDGMDGKIFIEHLILTSNYILLLGVKNFRGLIFAADKINLWTQVIGNKSYKFENPLHQIENDLVVLNSKIENTKILGKVLFINGSEFPKGKPDNVIATADIQNWPKKVNISEISHDLLDDWAQLTELATSHDLDKGVLINDGKSSFNISSFIAVVIFIMLWLAWRTKL